MFCFDTDVLSAVVGKAPSLPLIRRLARTPPEHQFTTAVTLGELLYGAARCGSSRLERQVRDVIVGALPVPPFDAGLPRSTGRCGPAWKVRPASGRADLGIASIVLSKGLTVVTGNVRHFGRVPDLKVEHWLST